MSFQPLCFRRAPDRIDDMPLYRRWPIFMHDGCPAHYANKKLKKVFNTKRYLSTESQNLVD